MLMPKTLRNVESEYSELEEEDLVQVLQAEIEALSQPSPYDEIMRKLTSKDWEKAEQNRGLRYNGHSARTRRYHEKKARDKEEGDMKSHES